MDHSKTTIVVGPPGTGKTTWLLSTIEEALTSGVKPNEIAFISFTKKAADEGRNRACSKFQLPPESFPHFRTLHSMAFKYLGMRRDQVIGWNHYRELGKMLGLEFKGRGEVAEDDVYGMNSADRMLFLEGLVRNTKSDPKTVWNKAFEDSIDWFEFERFVRALKMFKQSRMLYDYVDMLERFCLSAPGTLPKFKLLIVDEAQDLSLLQWDVVEMLANVSEKVYIAGDDDQAIHKWAGADVDTFISLQGRVVVLDKSFRIPATVFKLAQDVVSRISHRRKKVWSSRTEKGSVNWFNDLEEVDLSKGTWLLLARNGYMLDDMENFCLEQGFSFHSINRDPLRSPALTAIRNWETLRRGQDISAEQALETMKYMVRSVTPQTLVNQLKADDPGRQYGLPELRKLGLKTDKIWHESLTRISAKERDFFIAARRRGEPLLKEPRIHISTIHGSKGGQAENVLLLTDMSYRCYNNMQENFDDEVRVWYVAATRCLNSLNLIMPKTNLNFEM